MPPLGSSPSTSSAPKTAPTCSPTTTSARLEFTRASGRDTGELETRSRTALREAGDRATGLNVFGVAVRFFGSALDLWPADDPARPQMLFRYAKARFHAEAAGAEVLAERASPARCR